MPAAPATTGPQLQIAVFIDFEHFQRVLCNILCYGAVVFRKHGVCLREIAAALDEPVRDARRAA